MKKLLALILCVMLFVSVIPTAAFAYTPTVGENVHKNTKPDAATGVKVSRDLTPKYDSKTDARRAVEDLGKDINAMYTALAADQTVFGTAKTIYDMTDALSKDLLKGIGSFTYYDINGLKHEIYEDDLATNARKTLNLVIGNEITNYMNNRVGQFTSEVKVYKYDETTGKPELNADGSQKYSVERLVKPEKYIEVWGNAVKNALSSEKAQKNIEEMVTGLFALKVQKSVNDGADDLYTDIVDWDHWGEFNWGKLIDPDQSGLTSYRVWNPLPDAENHSALISTASNGVFGWTHVVDANGNWIANTSGAKSQNATQNWVYTIDGNADLAFAAGTGFYLPNS